MRETPKVMLVGPIDTKGRYQGGIAYIVNTLLNSCIVDSSELKILPFDTCRIERSGLDAGGISLGNIRNTIKLFRDIKRVVKKERPDVVYYNTSRGYALLKDLFVMKAVRKQCGKVIMHIHFGDAKSIVPTNGITKNLFLLLIRKYIDRIVLLSKATKMEFVNWGIPDYKMEVIYNFHNLDISDQEIEAKINEMKVKATKDIAFLGSLDERKGILDLIQAVNDIPYPIKLHICGTAKDKNVSDRINEIANKSDRIIMHGFVDKELKKNILLQSEILALPSYGEGFPIVLVEGLAAGCAILTTNVGAIPEVFSAENGVITTPGDIEAIKRGIEKIYMSNQLEAIMRHNRSMSKDYTIEKFYNSLKSVCLEECDEA